MSFSNGQVASAQATSAEVEAIIQKITDLQIQLLLARISELQAQIAEMLAKQSETQSSVVNLGARVETVASQTAKPVVVVPVPTPVSVTLGTASCSTRHPDPSYVISYGYPVQNDKVEVPFTVSGNWQEVKFIYNRYPTTAPSAGTSYILYTLDKQREEVVVTNSGNSSRFGIQSYPDSHTVDVYADGKYLGAKSISVNTCQ